MIRREWAKSVSGAVVCLAFLLPGPQTAFAHRPHDVVTSVELSPLYETDHALYAFVRENLFKSEDGGKSWRRLVRGFDNRFSVSSFCISSKDARTILASTRGDGIYRSRDAGESWARSNTGLDDLDISLVAVSESVPDLVLAAPMKQGLYLSIDKGTTWKRAAGIDSKITAVAFVPGDARTVFAGDDTGKLFRSEDGGANWEKIHGLKDRGQINVISVLPGPSKDKTLFAGTQNGGLFRSLDGGVTFQKAGMGMADLCIQDIVVPHEPRTEATIYAVTARDGPFYSRDNGNSWKPLGSGYTKDSQADEIEVPHFYMLRVAPGKTPTLFLGGFNGLFKSADGGVTWTEVKTLSPGTITAFDISPDYAKDSTLVAATYVGGDVWLSRDKGKSWKWIGFPGDFSKSNQDPRRYFDIAFSPVYAKDRTIFATLLYEKVLKSTDRGARWKPVTLPKMARGFMVLVSPDFAIDRTVFLFSQYGTLFRSTDGGENFSVLAEVSRTQGNAPPSAVISPDFKQDQTIFISGEKGIQRSTDGGVTWAVSGEGLPASGADATLAVSPAYAKDGTLFAGTGDSLYKTVDRGTKWARAGASGVVESLAVSPDYARDQTVVVSLKGRGFFRSTDGGATFTRAGDDTISFSAFACPHSRQVIQFSPDYAFDRTLFATGSAQSVIYRSTDAGATWETMPLPRSHFDLKAFAQKFKTAVLFFLSQHRILVLSGGLLLFGIAGAVALRRNKH